MTGVLKASHSTYAGHRGGENVYSIVEKNLIIKKYSGKKIFSSIETHQKGSWERDGMKCGRL